MSPAKDRFDIWEPIPYDAAGDVEAQQRRGFERRARKSLVWLDRRDRLEGRGTDFGEDVRWFTRMEVACVCTHDGEDLVLVNLAWSGFPDPPPWGLWSRASGNHDADWQPWGHFYRLPTAWYVPESIKSIDPNESHWLRADMPGA